MVLGPHPPSELEPLARGGGAGAEWEAAAPLPATPHPGDRVARPNPGAEPLTQLEYRHEA